MIATYILISQRRYTFSLQTDPCVCLSSGFHFIFNLSIHCVDTYSTAQCCLRVCKRRSREDIHILSLEDRMTCNIYFYKQIASRTSVCTRFTLLTDADALTIVNTCRYRYLNLLS